ncbi:MAG: endonuclease/exonuclease/phosphatase family protein [Lautropia sp.]|nr:endonuclease/exonuclease/phosphatase family protein [Lautropia sp.]
MSLRLRVATYNIHKGVVHLPGSLSPRPSVHELRDRLHALQPDIVFLQEVQGKNNRFAERYQHWPSDPQAQYLALAPDEDGGFEAVYGLNARYLHGHHGNALLSKYPVVSIENRDFSDHVLERRGVLHCVLQLGGRAVHCFVIHFGLFARSRLRQADALIKWIRAEVPHDAPLLVAGDFNDWRDQLSQHLIAGLSVHEVLSSARTYPALMPCLRMDRIYVRGFEVEQATVLGGYRWAKLSDHAPVVADLRMEDE